MSSLSLEPESESHKYAVLKYSDWEKLKRQMTDVVRARADTFWLVPDAVVLRLQDLTVAPLLHSYASQILSFTELLEAHGANDPGTLEALRSIADHMHTKALQAEALPYRKLPD